MSSEVGSFIAAMDMQEKIRQPPDSRNLVLMSRIVDSGVESEGLRRRLMKDLLDQSATDVFFFYDPTDEMTELIAGLPAERVGGTFQSVKDAIAAVMQIICPGDSLLIQGITNWPDSDGAIGFITDRLEWIFPRSTGNIQDDGTELPEQVSEKTTDDTGQDEGKEKEREDECEKGQDQGHRDVQDNEQGKNHVVETEDLRKAKKSRLLQILLAICAIAFIISAVVLMNELF